MMSKGMSWVEWLAIGFIATAGVIFLFGKPFLGASPGDTRESAGMKDAFAPFVAAMLAALCFGLGLSLFLVRPLLSLGLRAPFWLIPMLGVILFLWRDSVCRAMYGDESLSSTT